MSRCILVMGDNHGDVGSLERVLDDVEDEPIDLAVHVGDFTRAWRHDRELGVEQLRVVEPLLDRIDDAVDHGLLWVWGNQDHFGDIDYGIDAGTEIPADGYVTVDGQRFTNAPEHVEDDVVLVTHMEKWSLVDHFDGRAHFCGNTHLGRLTDRRLNSAFLQASAPDADEPTYGGYFVVELGDEGPRDVELRPLGDLERRTCERHGDRGVQFLPADWECMYCRDERILYRELAGSAFYGCADGDDGAAVTEADLVEHAVSLRDDPEPGFRRDFERYVADIGDDRYAPLAREDGEGDRLVVADEGYSY
ncbi:metallophosphoesterase family protein [Halostella litorea]|uniref:metallophosphoesterase family protein n=1 Tax=Halostella litorea TaxID=2528831 RepID=UPI001091E81A|nr:metallophosphoesterase family protein [Halostella litorea]